MTSEIIITNKDVVVCENDHPKVYIHTDRTGKVVYCQYCNIGYRYQDAFQLLYTSCESDINSTCDRDSIAYHRIISRF